MQNTQILSTQPPLPDSAPPERSARSVRAAAGAGPGGRALVFDACQVGVVLRAVLFVEVVVGVGAMYGASSPLQWLASLALLWGNRLIPATFAERAVAVMDERKITCLFAVKEGRPVGILHIHDCLRAGVV